MRWFIFNSISSVSALTQHGFYRMNGLLNENAMPRKIQEKIKNFKILKILKCDKRVNSGHVGSLLKVQLQKNRTSKINGLDSLDIDVAQTLDSFEQFERPRQTALTEFSSLYASKKFLYRSKKKNKTFQTLSLSGSFPV